MIRCYFNNISQVKGIHTFMEKMNFFYDDRIYKLIRTNGTTNFILSNSKVVKWLRRRLYMYGPVIIYKMIDLVLCIVLLQPCTDRS